MKKLLLTLPLLVLLLLSFACAETARDLTADAKLSVPNKAFAADRMRDRDYQTAYTAQKGKNEFVEVTLKEPCYGVYVCWGEKLLPWRVQVKEGKKWVDVALSDGVYAHEYLPLNGLTHFRIGYQSTKQQTLEINELFLFSEGDVPDFVQRWEPTVEKADLMVLVAHPDDEILFMGGLLPTYAGEQKKSVVVCYLTCATRIRRSEMLNALWLCGVRNYPDIGNFWDKYTTKLDKMYNVWGKSKVHKYVTELIRKYKPEVLVTQDVNGEYGHGAHRVCADSALTCVNSAADPAKFSASADTYGTWQVKKLYLHLYPENQITLLWDTPLESQNGKTGMEVAREAYKLHASQPQREYWVYGPEDEYSSCSFGLAMTQVGLDEEGNDLFEHIE